MSWEYSENKLVQDSAGNVLHDRLSWEVVYAYSTAVLDQNGTLGRKSYHIILLTRYLRTVHEVRIGMLRSICHKE